MPYLERDGDVFVLHLGDRDAEVSENRFHPDRLVAIHSLLDEVEAHDGPAALVTAATGKFWSNGLDIDWVGANLPDLPGYLDSVHDLYVRLLTFPAATVAAVQGHAFGAGAMLALVHDFRVMRADRGYWCLPEVQLNMPFTVGMSALIRSRLPIQTAVEAITTGRRYGGEDAVAAGIAEQAVTGDDVLAAAAERAAALTATRGPNLSGIKRGLHAPLISALEIRTDPSNFRLG
ncbi:MULTISPECIES: enoyl-CoA hydratase/isomerase family protein [Rhodococcus]|uniref:enoyl-CoA hydratase/isomerase family protein n=1 Tax=Rhodococcus TaxID=1827 RepID=UPI00132E78D1|nr:MULTISPECIES: enoyl-CoA hydratase/isomerase family protein [Rhodococcus]QHG84978.1 enoyl-CoA hydratase/isomerase family protein [Rhodococcus rhodochrous]QOH59225.1 enoyl-CoA hydratase [Rhodococcus rhodochrous]WAL45161.1 enoyl-CoA hydratase/isomerase family protein [Rhodococcus pyridinivorans]